MEIEWDIDDGYVGNSPHSLTIEDEEILWQDTIENAMEFIAEGVQEDFEQTISWYFEDESKIREKVEKLFESRRGII